MIERVTLVLGASQNPDRYSFKAIQTLKKYSYPVVAVGRRKSDLKSLKIYSGMPQDLGKIHTVTLYIGAKNQRPYYSYILSLRPSRIIFNPGTRNTEFEEIAAKAGIEVVVDCMLLMLNKGIY